MKLIIKFANGKTKVYKVDHARPKMEYLVIDYTSPLGYPYSKCILLNNITEWKVEKEN